MGKVDLESLPVPPLSKALLLFPIITSTCIDLNKTHISRLYNDSNVFYVTREDLKSNCSFKIYILKIYTSKLQRGCFIQLISITKYVSNKKENFGFLKHLQDNYSA